MAKSELHREYVLELENELQELERQSSDATRRLQLIVYPAMFAFILLAAFGFYLIYSLQKDIDRIANTMVSMTGNTEKNMDDMATSMKTMTHQMSGLLGTTKIMSGNIGNMTNNTVEMVNTINGMREATYDMAASANHLQRDMWSLNKNISTPMSFMNNFLPWKNSTSLPFQGTTNPLPRSRFSYQQMQPQTYGAIPFHQYPQIQAFANPVQPPSSATSSNEAASTAEGSTENSESAETVSE